MKDQACVSSSDCSCEQAIHRSFLKLALSEQDWLVDLKGPLLGRWLECLSDLWCWETWAV